MKVWIQLTKTKGDSSPNGSSNSHYLFASHIVRTSQHQMSGERCCWFNRHNCLWITQYLLIYHQPFMFWFINKSFNPRIGLVRDGTSINLKYTSNQEEARDRRALGKESWVVYENVLIDVYNEIYEVKLPIVKEGGDVTMELRTYITQLAKEWNLSDDVKWIRDKLFDKYIAIEWDIIWFVKKSDEQTKKNLDTNIWLFLMKLFLEGYYRFTPITRNINKGDSIEMQLWFDYTNANENIEQSNIKYKYKWKTFETPLYGVYAPMIIDYLFWDLVDFWGWRVLQIRQIEAIMALGKINFIAAPRGGGKSWIAALVAWLCMMREPVGAAEKTKPILINYFWETDEGNEQVIDYILTLPQKFWDFGMFKYKSWSNSLEFYDGERVSGRIRFKSSLSKSKGRGGRPTITIIDEAARIDESVYKTAFSNAIRDDTQIIAISTIDAETNKNRFYQMLISAENDQYLYEDIDDSVVRIWNKYWFSDKKSREDFTEVELAKAKKELRSSRLYVWLRYTLDDIEFIEEEEKKEKMRLAYKMDRNFIMAEFYSRFSDKTDLFELKGNIETKMPPVYDQIALGFDPATDYDNPALCLVWLLGWTIYVINSRRLEKDSERQYQQILDILSRLSRYYHPEAKQEERIPLFWVDLTYWWEYILSWLVLRGIPVDYPVKTTSSKQNDITRHWRYIHIPKKMMIDVVKDFFSKWYIKVNAELETKGGLIEEIGYYQPRVVGSKTKIEAVVWKDDQVSAMMIAVFCFYEDLCVIHAEIELEHINEKPKSLEEFIELQEQKRRDRHDANAHDIHIALWN